MKVFAVMRSRLSGWSGTGTALVLSGLLVAGCSTFRSEVNYDPCPPLAAASEAATITQVGTRIGQPVRIRFNGVYGQCLARDGYSDMEVVINLVMERNLAISAEIERVDVYVTLAVLDASDQVVSRKTVRDEFNVTGRSARSHPVFSVDIEVPDGHRVLVGLGRRDPES